MQYDCSSLGGDLDEALIDHYFKASCQKNFGWKHALISSTLLQTIAKSPTSVCFITITKNPYPWLLSLYNNPYHAQKTYETFEEFLTEPWVAVGREHFQNNFGNPIEMWNRKNASYLALADVAPTIRVRYEDVLANPVKSIEDIATRFDIPKKLKTVRNIQVSTKEKEKDFSYYQNYYLGELWKKELSGKAITFINARIDKKIMTFFNYKLLKTS